MPQRTPIGWVKEGIQTVARSAGLAIKPYPEPSALEDYLKAFFQLSEINCVLDIGAHTGGYYRFLRSLGYAGHIISFEPVLDTFLQLKQVAGTDPKWTGFNYGLNDSDAETEIHVYSSSDFNSLYDLHEEVKRSYRLTSASARTERVSLRRLDEAITECVPNLDQARIFMKMDTQGHDLAVMRGAAGALDRILGIQSELAGIPMYEGVPRMDEALQFHYSNGFVPAFFGAVNTFSSTLVTLEWDVVFRRKPDRFVQD